MKSKLKKQLSFARQKELAEKRAGEKVNEFNKMISDGLKEAIAAKGYVLTDVKGDISVVDKKPKKRNLFVTFFATLFGIRLNNDFETGYWLNFEDVKKRELLLLIVSNYNKEGIFISEFYYQTRKNDTEFQIVD